MVTRKTTDFSKLDFVNGETLLIDKPSQWTSFKVVQTIRKAINVKRVGHTGTLDPMATGLLIILTGKMTKEMKSFEGLDKTYTGTILLGKTSPSMDTETEMMDRELNPNLTTAILSETRDTFIGDIEQVPPMYSALKVKGKKLYELARKGKEVKRDARTIHIDKFELTEIKLPEIRFEIKCSKGTYIRVIANDFGEKLGSGAVLSNLRRTAIGKYSIIEALKVEEFIQKIAPFA
ncbi:MAG: tRNA pseudouridine(55) synthase TruB [Ignavibacteria bacterium]|jgi:tRNA pseudouridine55 synthase